MVIMVVKQCHVCVFKCVADHTFRPHFNLCVFKCVADQTCDPSTTCVFSKHISLEPNQELCQTIYGITPREVYDRIKFTNSYYGSDEPKGTRIVFVNGEIRMLFLLLFPCELGTRLLLSFLHLTELHYLKHVYGQV